MRLTAAILAAGSGSRLGGVPKQFRLLAGRPLWHYSYETARAVCAKFDAEILLVLPPDAEEAFQTAEKLAPDARLIAGGTSRGESALKALQAARGELIALHDAARPFASPDLWEKLVEAAGNGRAAVPVLPVPDSLKRRAGSGWEPGGAVSHPNASGLSPGRTAARPHGPSRRSRADRRGPSVA